MKVLKIFKCSNGHYFKTDVCPYCGGAIEKEYEQREGDCIDCGQLCPAEAYCCNSPVPINDISDEKDI